MINLNIGKRKKFKQTGLMVWYKHTPLYHIRLYKAYIAKLLYVYQL